MIKTIKSSQVRWHTICFKPVPWESWCFLKYQLLPASSRIEIHSLEIPTVLPLFRLLSRSKMHPVLPRHKHPHSIQKKRCKWNLKWQRLTSISLPWRQQATLAEKADRNEPGDTATGGAVSITRALKSSITYYPPSLTHNPQHFTAVFGFGKYDLIP